MTLRFCAKCPVHPHRQRSVSLLPPSRRVRCSASIAASAHRSCRVHHRPTEVPQSAPQRSDIYEKHRAHRNLSMAHCSGSRPGAEDECAWLVRSGPTQGLGLRFAPSGRLPRASGDRPRRGGCFWQIVTMAQHSGARLPIPVLLGESDIETTCPKPAGKAHA
jgi:hypothetical protein